MGFTLTPEERDALVARDARNAERIFPYLGGQEVNSSPTQTFDRYVISFGDMSLDEAKAWPDLLDIVREKVKPERDQNNRRHLPEVLVAVRREAPSAVRRHRPLARCLVTSRVSKHLIFAWQPTDRIFSDTLYVFPVDTWPWFTVLQSRIHEPWAWLLSSSMEDRLRYSASDCFDTFPFPRTWPTPTSPAPAKPSTPPGPPT
ncbi:MAG: type IIL restriction-modification enzyme MmeI [bacterium]